nr:hypothetical protein [Bacilli bacterium]
MMSTILRIMGYRKRRSLFSFLFIGLVVAILVGTFQEKAPFWISAFGTPIEDSTQGIFDLFPFGWILFNLVILYISFSITWSLTPFLFRMWRLSGRATNASYQMIFALATGICLIVLLVSGLFCILFSVLFGRFDGHHMALHTFLPVLWLWFLGSVLCVWLSMLVTMMTRHAFAGLMLSTGLIIVSAFLYPHDSWMPGMQWIFGAHLGPHALSFLGSSLYLLIAIVVINGIGSIAVYTKSGQERVFRG